jgi:hypothetical protein
MSGADTSSAWLLLESLLFVVEPIECSLLCCMVIFFFFFFFFFFFYQNIVSRRVLILLYLMIHGVVTHTQLSRSMSWLRDETRSGNHKLVTLVVVSKQTTRGHD